jgi:hypothetical protein
MLRFRFYAGPCPAVAATVVQAALYKQSCISKQALLCATVAERIGVANQPVTNRSYLFTRQVLHPLMSAPFAAHAATAHP